MSVGEARGIGDDIEELREQGAAAEWTLLGDVTTGFTLSGRDGSQVALTHLLHRRPVGLRVKRGPW